MKDILDNQITGIRISRNEAKTDEFDIETAISYTTQFIRNLARQWQNMDVRQKGRLQKLVLPERITYDRSTQTFGTAVLSPIFRLNEEFSGDESDFVAAVLRDWHPIIANLQQIYAFVSENRPIAAVS